MFNTTSLAPVVFVIFHVALNQANQHQHDRLETHMDSGKFFWVAEVLNKNQKVRSDIICFKEKTLTLGLLIRRRKLGKNCWTEQILFSVELFSWKLWVVERSNLSCPLFMFNNSSPRKEILCVATRLQSGQSEQVLALVQRGEQFVRPLLPDTFARKNLAELLLIRNKPPALKEDAVLQELVPLLVDIGDDGKLQDVLRAMQASELENLLPKLEEEIVESLHNIAKSSGLFRNLVAQHLACRLAQRFFDNSCLEKLAGLVWSNCKDGGLWKEAAGLLIAAAFPLTETTLTLHLSRADGQLLLHASIFAEDRSKAIGFAKDFFQTDLGISAAAEWPHKGCAKIFLELSHPFDFRWRSWQAQGEKLNCCRKLMELMIPVQRSVKCWQQSFINACCTWKLPVPGALSMSKDRTFGWSWLMMTKSLQMSWKNWLLRKMSSKTCQPGSFKFFPCSWHLWDVLMQPAWLSRQLNSSLLKADRAKLKTPSSRHFAATATMTMRQIAWWRQLSTWRSWWNKKISVRKRQARNWLKCKDSVHATKASTAPRLHQSRKYWSHSYGTCPTMISPSLQSRAVSRAKSFA